MYAFLCNFRPRSVNAVYKTSYYNELKTSFQRYHGVAAPLTENLYGFVYYFYRANAQLDADNLSKPIWDALRDIAYADDRLIRFRSAGTFDLQNEGIDVLDISDIPDYLIDDFLRMIDTESHILYVEFGRLDYKLFRFQYEK